MKFAIKHLLAVAAVSLTCASARAASYDEWYDPTDWFDGNNYEYDSNLGLDYSYYDDDSWTSSGYDGSDDYWSDSNYDYGYNDDWGYDNDSAIGGYGDSEIGYDWGFNRGYGEASSWSEGNQQSSQSRQNASSQKSNQKQRTVSGTLERSRNMNFKNKQNQPTRLTVSQLELQDGRDVLVAYRTQTGRSMNISEGDRVKATGKVVRINGRRVLLADQLQAGGQTFNVRQPLSGNRGSQSSAYRSSSNSQPQRGRVEQTRNVRSEDGDKTLLFIRLQDGRTAIVDLDPHMSLSGGNTSNTGSAPGTSSESSGSKSGKSSSSGTSSSSSKSSDSGNSSDSESNFNPSSWPSNVIAPSDYTDDKQ